MTVIDQLFANPGLYVGLGHGVPQEGASWIGRLVVALLPGSSGVSLDYEAMSPQHQLQHREHSLLGRTRGSVGHSNRGARAGTSAARVLSSGGRWQLRRVRCRGSSADSLSVSGDVEADIEIHPVTAVRIADVGDLFQSNATTRGCWCMWFLLSAKERHSGWGAGNRARFEDLVTTSEVPAGVLAYRDGVPVGWCAVGPRSRYPTAIGPRTKILKGRDAAEDDAVWLVPCFFVRVGFRRAGTTYRLLHAAVELAGSHGAKAIEGFPVVDENRTDAFLGSERLFSACGFTCVARPTPRRAVMRLELSAAVRATSAATSSDAERAGWWASICRPV